MMLSNYDIIVRILISLAFGAIVGLEREVKDCPAGLRTHSLVCLGATVFTLASLLLGGANADISRIAGQVVVGIGFIGGGVIFKSKDHVIGLTTAASLWVAAAVGLVIGLGAYFIGAVALIATLFILLAGTAIERHVFHKKKIN
jgi:putative Mg2+ transporter-C (MgtC) family protein